jgi:F-type H+-transporting ATPase subunit b
MAKITFYSVLFTVFMWCGGMTAPGVNNASDVSLRPTSVAAANEHAEAPDHATIDTDAAPDTHAAADEDGHGEAQVNLLDVTLGPFLWQLILFLILLGVLAKFVWPPILSGLREREGKIRYDLQQAEDAAKQAQATLAEYKKQLAEAQKQAQRIVDESRGAANKVAAQLKDEAQTQITQMRDRAEADIDAAKERAVSEIYNQAATLATQVAGQILRREINADDQSTLIKESIDKFRSAGRN